MDRLQAMHTFVRVVETGSFSAVARERHTTQSTISKQIAALEHALGVRLLNRSTRALALSEAGAHYFEQARRLVAEVSELEAGLRQGEQRLSGPLRVAAAVGFGRLKLMPLVQRFLEAHPDVSIDLRLHDGFVDLVEQGVDVAVRIGELGDSSLIARRIGTSYRMALASRSYLASLPAAPRSPADLARHNCLVYTELSAGNAWLFTAGENAGVAAGTTQTIRVRGNLQSNSSEVIRSAVLSGMGIAYSPSWLFDAEMASGDVVRLLPGWVATSPPIHLVYPRARAQAAKVRAFSDFVASALRLGPG
ncbi:LysR family transcriptional regulator [Jeongeupia naejangsanensis]|uniref:LysR family transcriptional regulator n=1 Tax=Jeongeupia naejangsanensis TaxID=613195 RepID=A0ABS2BQF1_9NEIS|nr:LysR family transcriptional regulator [Jeongeupia naejangsanensis]MBM3117870.1 LysR family transcriptional regulator [Jeongeupia naejangsanensis]